MKPVYSVLQQLHRRYGITDFEVTGTYVSSLNYYREQAGDWAVPEFKFDEPEFSHGRAVYALDGVYWRDFIGKEKLRIIYKAPFSDAVVAIAPGVPIPDGAYPK